MLVSSYFRRLDGRVRAKFRHSAQEWLFMPLLVIVPTAV
jgi:hypothetical protein